MYHDNTVHSISPSAATADHQNTMRDSLSSFSRGRCSRMLYDFRSVSGSLVTRTFPVGWCGTNTIHTATQPTPTVMRNHNTFRPTVTLKQVLPNESFSARTPLTTVLQPKPPCGQRSHRRHTSFDAISVQINRCELSALLQCSMFLAQSM